MREAFRGADLPEVRVLIAIQARSNSTRLPGKIYLPLGKKMILQHVIDAAKRAKQYVERPSHKVRILCDVAVVYPDGDERIPEEFGKSGAVMISGDEQDVLSRYLTAQRLTDADYVVRLTSDCPLIFDFIISKHINTAVYNRHDYVSNVEESCRQIADGLDCEIMSKRALEWLADNATEDDEREHVTLALRKRKCSELSKAFVSSKLDTSSMKLSIDTLEDYERIKGVFHQREFKHDTQVLLFGHRGIYEL